MGELWLVIVILYSFLCIFAEVRHIYFTNPEQTLSYSAESKTGYTGSEIQIAKISQPIKISCQQYKSRYWTEWGVLYEAESMSEGEIPSTLTMYRYKNTDSAQLTTRCH